MLEDGLRIGHILDPRSGRPVVRRASVTVWHPDAPGRRRTLDRPSGHGTGGGA